MSQLHAHKLKHFLSLQDYSLICLLETICVLFAEAQKTTALCAKSNSSQIDQGISILILFLRSLVAEAVP